MKVSALSVLMLAALSACDFAPSGLKPFEVDVQTPIPCHQELPPEPQWALTTTDANAGIADQAKAVLVEIHQRQAYEERLKAQILACK